MKRASVARQIPVWGTLAAVLGTACFQSVTEPRYVDVVFLKPDSANLEVGQSVLLEVGVLNPRGEHMPERVDQVGWSLSDEERATVEVTPDGLRVTALALGTVLLTAELGRGSGTAELYVHPSGLDRIEILPAPVELVVGERVTLEALLLDSSGSALSPDGFRISWKINADAIAFPGLGLGPSHRIIARAVGSTRLTLVVGSLRASTDLVVRPP